MLVLFLIYVWFSIDCLLDVVLWYGFINCFGRLNMLIIYNLEWIKNLLIIYMMDKWIRWIKINV